MCPRNSYKRATANALKLAESGVRVRFAGHSLGGGLATAQAIVSGYDALVFNPSGVRAETVEGHDLPLQDKLVTNIMVQGEFLAKFQDSAPKERVKLANALPNKGSLGRYILGIPASADLDRVAANTPRASNNRVLLQQVEAGIDYSAQNRGVIFRPAIIGMFDAHKIVSVLNALAYTRQK